MLHFVQNNFHIVLKVLFWVHFCLYCLNKISDIVKDIGYSIRLFAHNTSLYTIVDFRLQAGQRLNRDLSTILKWADSSLVTFNPSKTLSMLTSRKKRNFIFHPPISMDGMIINETSSRKQLGLLSQKLAA